MIKGRKIGASPAWLAPAITGVVVLVLISSYFANRPDVEVPAKTDTVTAAKDPVDNAAIDRGKRGYVLTGDLAGPIGYVEAGEKVDVIASFPGGLGGTAVTLTVVRAAAVLKADKKRGFLMIAVEPSEAEKLGFAQANGRLYVSICPPGPDTAVKGEGVSLEDI